MMATIRGCHALLKLHHINGIHCTMQAHQSAEEERQGREDATAAVLKLNSVIMMVRDEMSQQQAAYSRRVRLGRLLMLLRSCAAVRHWQAWHTGYILSHRVLCSG